MVITGFRRKGDKIIEYDFDTSKVFSKTKKAVDKTLAIGASALTFGIVSKGVESTTHDLGNKFIGPSVPVGTTPTGGAGLYQVFHDAMMPYIYDMGNAMVMIFFAFSAYQIIRKEHKQGFERVKWIAFGDIILHGVDPFLLFITKIADGMSSTLSNSMQKKSSFLDNVDMNDLADKAVAFMDKFMNM